MTSPGLAVRLGQYSGRGRKAVNQDFHGAVVPGAALARTKGIAIAIADGISTSDVSQVAAETAVKGFLEDYYATSESWSVKTSVERVVASINAWLHAETRRDGHGHDRDRGYVCTFSAVVLKSRTAYLFHVGDARIARIRGGALEPLTTEHRVRVSSERSYLSRALGAGPRVEIDHDAVPIEAGDVLMLSTDGVHEFVDDGVVVDALGDTPDLDAVARALCDDAVRRGSPDNVTVQLVAIDAVPTGDAGEFVDAQAALPPLADLAPRSRVDDYEIVRELHGSHRSHVYLAVDVTTNARVVLKTPGIDARTPAALERFALQEWIAQRIDNAHVVKAHATTGRRTRLYAVTEYVDGQTLAQWMVDHPVPALEAVRRIVEQLAAGLLAFHRLEMVHRDLRPENVMIDANGTVRIIDFGSARVAGIDETSSFGDVGTMPGTPQYSAPECFVGDPGTPRADLYALGVLAYRMLTGRFPYGTDVAKAKTATAQRRLRYRSAMDDERAIPAWIDGALRRAVHPDPLQRYAELSEFTADLRVPNPAVVPGRRSLLDRDPTLFWRAVSLVLVLVVAILSYRLSRA